MSASEWKSKIIAIGRASAAGDDGPLGILCDHLAAMSDLCDPKPPAELPLETSNQIVDESGGLFDEPKDDVGELHSED